MEASSFASTAAAYSRAWPTLEQAKKLLEGQLVSATAPDLFWLDDLLQCELDEAGFRRGIITRTLLLLLLLRRTWEWRFNEDSGTRLNNTVLQRVCSMFTRVSGYGADWGITYALSW